MAQPPKKPRSNDPDRAAAPVPHRVSPRKLREQRRQRQIMLLSGIAIGVALVAILAGVLYDQVYIPSQPVARVGDSALSKSAYWNEKRNQSAANIGQALYLITFGQQFAQQVLGQVSAVDQGITTLRSDPVDTGIVENWIDRQLVLQGARTMNISASDGEVAQLIVENYGPSFGPVITPTVGLTPTIQLATEVASTPTAALTASPAATLPAGVTATPAATATVGPTFTPVPTQIPTSSPVADVALKNQTSIFEKLYTTYVEQLVQIDPQRKARLSADDFKNGLLDQFQRQVLMNKIEEQLVPDASFSPSTDPKTIDTRHILLKVTLPVSSTEAQREEAFAARRADAEAILQQLRSGADFAALAKEKSEDYNTKADGGSLPGFDTSGKTSSGTQIDPAIVQAVSALQENQISDLVRTPYGWHIVQLVKRNVDTREQQLRAARTKAFDEWLVQQRSKLSIEHFPAQTPTATALPTGTAAPLPTQELGGNPSPTPLATEAVPTPTAGASGTATLPTTTPSP